ncbi:5928_t:CDS:2 [Paraglomus occultum]|uniref:5928_t:CDS:1 n=1 Tax=Paraglomus occultum TaxID=144539 RepID=A0A9N9C7D8_9GLOM|nr:5928_t:CDS:2 [Paraglomus occultum]
MDTRPLTMPTSRLIIILIVLEGTVPCRLETIGLRILPGAEAHLQGAIGMDEKTNIEKTGIERKDTGKTSTVKMIDTVIGATAVEVIGRKEHTEIIPHMAPKEEDLSEEPNPSIERRDSTTLYVGNLPYNFREQDVADMFERYGRLRKVTVQIDHYTGRNKGFAFVEFEDRRDAEDAFDKYNGFTVEGRRLKLDWDIGLSKKDQHRRDKYGPNDYGGRSADPYGRASSPVRGYSPNYRGGARTPSPYRSPYRR